MTHPSHEKALPIRIPNLSFVVTLLILLAAGAILYGYITPDGLGLTNDSADYLGGARAILAGDGYVRYSGDRQPRPITQFPPGYAFAIAKAAALGAPDVFAAAKAINGIAIVLNLFLIAALALATTRRESAAAFAAALTLVSVPFLRAQSSGLSEALASVWILGGLLLLSVALRKARRPLWAWLLIGAVFGVAVLIRYAALIFFAGALFLAFANGRTARDRWTPAFGIAAGFSVFFLPWLIRGRIVSDGGVNRTFALHFPTADRLWDGVRTVMGFFLPEAGGIVEKPRVVWAGLILITLAALTVRTALKLIAVFRGTAQHPDGEAMPLAPADFFVYFLLLYLAELFLTAVFVDGSTVFDDRMLYPFFILTISAVTSAAAGFMEKPGQRAAAIIVLTLFGLSLLEDSLDLIRSFHADGQGFAGRAWRESETARAIAGLPDGITCFSNRRTFLGLVKELPCYVLPVGFNAATQQASVSFTADREWMRSEILSGKAAAIVFGFTDDLDPESGDFSYYDALFAELPLYGAYSDGKIFARPDSTR